jgi:hypothetical protein
LANFSDRDIMGAPTAQVQSPQSSQPAAKGAGQSPSSEAPSGKGGKQLSALSGQPTIGQPNLNGNTDLQPVNSTFVAQPDGSTAGNPYPNTVGNMGSVAGGPNGQPMGKGGGSGQGGGKGVTRDSNNNNPFMGYDEGTGRNPLLNNYQGPQGPGANF